MKTKKGPCVQICQPVAPGHTVASRFQGARSGQRTRAGVRREICFEKVKKQVSSHSLCVCHMHRPEGGTGGPLEATVLTLSRDRALTSPVSHEEQGCKVHSHKRAAHLRISEETKEPRVPDSPWLRTGYTPRTPLYVEKIP